MNCINLKQKLDRTLYCKERKCTIKISECNGCPYKKYKENTQYNVKKCEKITKIHKISRKNVQIKKKTNKLAKMERERFSLFTEDLDHCIICGKSPVNKHEIFFGAKNRLNSIKYGLVIPLCTTEHHNQVGCTGIHFDKVLREHWQIKAQKKFQEVYPELDFLEIFGRNYLK